MTISINTSYDHSQTMVSNSFIDFIMPRADERYVKLYLYLLRLCQQGSTFDIDNMADVLHETRANIGLGLSYWENEGLLTINYDVNGFLTGVSLHSPDDIHNDVDVNATNYDNNCNEYLFVNKAVAASSAAKDNRVAKPKASRASSRLKNLPATGEILLSKENAAIHDNVIKTFDDLRILSAFSDKHIEILDRCIVELGCNDDFIVHTFEYCNSLKLDTDDYYNVAVLWHSNSSISGTVPKLCGHMSLSNQITGEVQSLLGSEIKTNFKFVEYITNWILKGYSKDKIKAACITTLAHTKKPSMGYVNSILENSASGNSEVKFSVKPVGEFFQYKQRDYSKEELTCTEQRLMQRMIRRVDEQSN